MTAGQLGFTLSKDLSNKSNKRENFDFFKNWVEMERRTFTFYHSGKITHIS